MPYSLIIHCSDSDFGCANIIDDWHRARGFNKIGYHFVILNGFITGSHFKDNTQISFFDGTVEIGRPLDNNSILEKNEYGAGVLGANLYTIHVCLIGKTQFTWNQLKSLEKLCFFLSKQFNIALEDIKGHYELDPKKLCPGFDMRTLRSILLQQNILIKSNFGRTV